MTKYNLNDVTFTIPVKIDSNDRKENLKIIISYLNNNFTTNILVYEEVTTGAQSEIKDMVISYGAKYISGGERDDKIFHRTKFLNDMAKLSTTPIISNYDCDVVFDKTDYIEAVTNIRNGSFEMVFPYNGNFYDVPYKFKNEIFDKSDVSVVNLSECGLCHSSSVGGSVFFNKNAFIAGGMENEKFLSWGYEDNERVERFSKLGLRIGRTRGVLYHLTHVRLLNSNPHGPYFTSNMNEYHRICKMTKPELQTEIKSWPWTQ